MLKKDKNKPILDALYNIRVIQRKIKNFEYSIFKKNLDLKRIIKYCLIELAESLNQLKKIHKDKMINLMNLFYLQIK